MSNYRDGEQIFNLEIWELSPDDLSIVVSEIDEMPIAQRKIVLNSLAQVFIFFKTRDDFNDIVSNWDSDNEETKM